MEPTGHGAAMARPVPRTWLEPHGADAARLDRLIADRELAERLHAAGYVGRDWDYFAAELIKYGYAVLIAWMRDGVIWRRLATRNIGGLPTPPPWEWHLETWTDLASDVLISAVPKFRDTVLATGRWDPNGRASLKTFFIGHCLIRFPNPYRSWHTAVTARNLEVPDDIDSWRHADPTGAGPEHDLVRREDLAHGLATLDDRTREALVLLDQGYDQAEVADRIGTSRKAVEMIVRRHRARLDRARPDPTPQATAPQAATPQATTRSRARQRTTRGGRHDAAS